ncbi:MAG TPA: hypothetical protein VJB02_02820 [Coxiellaceae bacterium]|nr:hypothetical protein [Coxiellaceae bacterium]
MSVYIKEELSNTVLENDCGKIIHLRALPFYISSKILREVFIKGLLESDENIPFSFDKQHRADNMQHANHVAIYLMAHTFELLLKIKNPELTHAVTDLFEGLPLDFKNKINTEIEELSDLLTRIDHFLYWYGRYVMPKEKFKKEVEELMLGPPIDNFIEIKAMVRKGMFDDIEKLVILLFKSWGYERIINEVQKSAPWQTENSSSEKLKISGHWKKRVKKLLSLLKINWFRK